MLTNVLTPIIRAPRNPGYKLISAVIYFNCLLFLFFLFQFIHSKTVTGFLVVVVVNANVFYILFNSSMIKVFLQYALNVSLLMSCQSTFSAFETACSLFDRQLKPIFLRFDLVNSIPLLLSWYCLFNTACMSVASGIW